jgi:glycosyltransferase involved in cell wall biosynthesis
MIRVSFSSHMGSFMRFFILALFFACSCINHSNGEPAPDLGELTAAADASTLSPTGERIEPVERPKLCLHMIVKNESHVIERCLKSVLPLIDYWVIVDTGSTDGTQEIIKAFLKEIPGELHEIPWKNWGETRSEALSHALLKAEYILLMDADDILEFDKDAALPPLNKDQYCMWRGSKGFTYQRPQIIKGDLPWRYLGVTHEYLDCPLPYTSEILENVKYITLDDGALSRDLRQKFLKNVLLLEEGLKKEPDNSRYAFYLAESYRDAGEKGKALEMYQKRIDMGGWDQEIFWSKLQMSHIMRDLKFPTNVVLASYKDAHDFRPHRSEPVYFMAEILNQRGRYEEAYRILKTHELAEKPAEKDALFNVDWIEDYGLLFQLSISSYYANHCEESLDACNELLQNADLPDSWRTLTEANREFPLLSLKEKISR